MDMYPHTCQQIWKNGSKSGRSIYPDQYRQEDQQHPGNPSITGADRKAAGNFIIAEDVEGEALMTLIKQLRGTFQVVAVKVPGYG